MNPVNISLLLGLVLRCSATGQNGTADSGVLSVCPPFDPAICPLAKPGPAGCQNDSQCPQDKKCCCSNCGLMCVTPVQVRPGRCPPILAKCKLPLQDPRCQSDLDCPGKQKCCDICGKSCWDPWKEPAGVCPVNEVQPVRGLQCAAVLCSRDLDCAADEKCCLSGDGKKCVKVSSDSGVLSVCPPFDPAICPLAKPGPAGCQNDSQCPQDKKCCCSNCGLMCVTPVQVRPGRCPPILAKCKLPLQDPQCQSDLDCPGKQKCCDICGKSCWDPWKEPAGVCPVNEVQPVGGLQCAAVLCSRDSDCAADENCCLSGDGKTCVKVSSDSGVLSVCPPFDPAICPLAKPGPAGCQNDSQCPQDKKCCCSNCGLMCVTPVQVRPGRCPPILAKCKLPLQDPQCQSDLDCPGKQKCCDICGKSCWDPWKEPEGICPVNEVQAVGGLQCAAVLCSRDLDCAADEKCCLSGDGKKCVKVSSDSGLLSVCPPFDPAICPLAKPGPAGCQNDSQCPQDKKCCCSNCGLMCVTPVQVRPGRCPPILAKCKLPLQDPQCQSDLDCPGKQKCCDICGKSCWDPWKEPAGVCPVNEVQPVGGLQCAAVLCSRDSDCAADEKCCLSGDGKTCVKTFSDVDLLKKGCH